MIGEQIRAELSRPLEGDRRWIRTDDGLFTHRFNPEHLALVMAERARVRVEQDVILFRRYHTRYVNATKFA